MDNVPIFQLWLEFEEWHDDTDLENDFFNAIVEIADGRRYALNVWTFKYLEEARKEAIEWGDKLFGSYLEPPDLFVEKLERTLMKNVIADLLLRQAMRAEWLVAGDATTHPA